MGGEGGEERRREIVRGRVVRESWLDFGLDEEGRSKRRFELCLAWDVEGAVKWDRRFYQSTG
jgi:hypothetical protein